MSNRLNTYKMIVSCITAVLVVKAFRELTAASRNPFDEGDLPQASRNMTCSTCGRT